jgi:predicted DNA-binding ribbon-helix-helix protein
VANFASLLRCACTLYLEQPAHVMAKANAELARAI